MLECHLKGVTNPTVTENGYMKNSPPVGIEPTTSTTQYRSCTSYAREAVRKIWSTRNPSYTHLLEEMEDDEEAVAREIEDQQRADLEELTPLYQPVAHDFAEAVGNF